MDEKVRKGVSILDVSKRMDIAMNEHDEDFYDRMEQDYQKEMADSFEVPTLARVHCLISGVGCAPDFKRGMMMCVDLARAGDVAAKQFLYCYNQKTAAAALVEQSFSYGVKFFEEKVVPLFGRCYRDEFLADLIIGLEEVEFASFFAPKEQRELTFKLIFGIFESILPGVTERSHLAWHEKGPVQGDKQFQIPGMQNDEYVQRLTEAYANWVWRSHCFRFNKRYSADDVADHAKFVVNICEFIKLGSCAAVLCPLMCLETIYDVDGIPFK